MIRLVAITRPLIPEVETSEQLLAYFARVSSSANQLAHASGPKLIRSLLRRNEWSPLEMVGMTMEIVTTRDVARQILRHRSFSFQEFSQRYAEVTDEPVLREARAPHPTDRQTSVPITDSLLKHIWEEIQHKAAIRTRALYKEALERGIAKEVARVLLPEGLTPSRLYMAGSLRSWWHYCELRGKESTQKEHREIALAAKEILLDQFPSLREEEGEKK